MLWICQIYLLATFSNASNCGSETTIHRKFHGEDILSENLKTTASWPHLDLSNAEPLLFISSPHSSSPICLGLFPTCLPSGCGRKKCGVTESLVNTKCVHNVTWYTFYNQSKDSIQKQRSRCSTSPFGKANDVHTYWLEKWHRFEMKPIHTKMRAYTTMIFS